MKRITGRAMDSIDAEDSERIAGYVRRMPDDMRRVITLRKVYGLSQIEIADRLHLSMQDVEHLLAEALRFCSDRMFDGVVH